MTRSLYALAVSVVAVAAPLAAQARPQPQDPKPAVPRTHLPPPGMCRIWLENVPPAQQPAPTDCASAVRNQPRNGKVIFSEDPKLPLVKSLNAPTPPPRKAPDEQPRPPVKTGPDGKPIKPDSR